MGDRRLRSPTSSGNTRSGERAGGLTRLRVWCENRGFRTMAAVLLTFAAAGPFGGTGKLTIAVQA
jgi:hypothetical protein